VDGPRSENETANGRNGDKEKTKKTNREWTRMDANDREKITDERRWFGANVGGDFPQSPICDYVRNSTVIFFFYSR
jgi:hypothetical protein